MECLVGTVIKQEISCTTIVQHWVYVRPRLSFQNGNIKHGLSRRVSFGTNWISFSSRIQCSQHREALDVMEVFLWNPTTSQFKLHCAWHKTCANNGVNETRLSLTESGCKKWIFVLNFSKKRTASYCSLIKRPTQRTKLLRKVYLMLRRECWSAPKGNGRTGWIHLHKSSLQSAIRKRKLAHRA